MSEDVAPLRSSQKAADVQGFFQLVSDALDIHVKTDGAPDSVVPIYVHSFPKERLSKPGAPFDVITHHVLDGTMSATSNDGNRIPRAPSRRDRIPHPTMAGYNLCIQAWWEDATVIFTIWSKTNTTADDLTIWFHKFIMRYANFYDFFKARGISNFRFVKRLEDTTEDQEGQELSVRRLLYSFRIEYLDSFVERQLTDITLNTQIERNVSTIELSAD